MMDVHVLPRNLAQFGLNRLSSQLRSILARGICMAEGAEHGTSPAFPALHSGVSLVTVAPVRNTSCLVIDSGGTHTKVGLRIVDRNGASTWRSIFDLPNSTLDEGALPNPMHRYMNSIFERTDRSLSSKSLSGIAVVWSNAARIEDLSGTAVRGVTALVAKREEAYQKREPFIRLLKNGDDVGGYFLSAAHERGIRVPAFMIGNDTVFTQKAVPEASAGIIASSGANATFMVRGEICNGEIATHLLLEKEELPSFLHHLAPVRLERLVSGIGIELNFNLAIVALANEGWGELRQIADRIERRLEFFEGKDMSKLLNRNYAEFLERNDESLSTGARAMETLTELARILAREGGIGAGLMAYLSVCNQIDEERPIIALDSSQARLLPGYFDAMQETLALLKPGAILRLLRPLEMGHERQISVPMIGAAAALDPFLS